jgi:hypothetical protein
MLRIIDMKTIHLYPDNTFSSKGNLIFFATYVIENFEPIQNLQLKIPKKIFSSLTKNEFNQYFTEILIDSGFDDNLLFLKVVDSEMFEVTF